MRKLLMWAAAFAAAFALMVGPAQACDGYVTIDGCVTIERYNEMFSYERLSAVPSLSDPSRSVAEVYGITDDGVEPVDRPRSFMGVPEPTIREIITGKIWAL